MVYRDTYFSMLH